MKKIVFIMLGVVLLTALTVLNLELTNKYSHNGISLIMLKSAVAQDGECIPNDCPWWNPFCDDWDGADAVSWFEHISGTSCTKYVRDCYPGTDSCSELTLITCM